MTQASIINPLLEKLNEFISVDKYCDLTIVTDERFFRCHRLILAATCNYFDVMFDERPKDESIILQQQHILNTHVIVEVLRFAYTNQVVVTAENVYSLIKANELLELPIFEKKCMEYIGQKLPIPNAPEILVFARQTMKGLLANVVRDYILENYSTCSRTDEFLRLLYDDFSFLIDRHRFSDDKEYLEVIIRWCTYASDEDRKSLFVQFMNTIDLTSLQPDCTRFLAEEVFPTTRAVTSSGGDPGQCVSRDTSSLHIFVQFHEECPYNQWRIYSLVNGYDWRQSVSYSYFNDATLSKFSRSQIRTTIRNVSLGNHLYSLSQYKVEPNKPSPVYIEQSRFRRASSINLIRADVYELKKPPAGNYDCDMCASLDSIYLYNRSIVEEPDFNEHGSDCYIYNLDLDQWSPVAAPRQRVKDACITADNNLVFMVGGILPNGQNVPTFQVYDSRTPQWHEFSATRNPFVRAACCMHKGKLYLSGGENDPCDVQIFDLEAGKWMQGKRTIRYRTNHRLVSHGERLWAIGNNNADLTVELNNTMFPDEWSIDGRFTNSLQEYIGQHSSQEQSLRSTLNPPCACTSCPWNNTIKVQIQDAVCQP